MGTFQSWPWAAVVATLGIILGAAYMLWMFQRVMFGPITKVNAEMSDLNLREVLCFAPLVIMALWIGLYPKPFFDLMDAPVKKLVTQVDSNFYKAPALAEAQAQAKATGMQGMEAPAEHHEGAAHEGEAHEGKAHEGNDEGHEAPAAHHEGTTHGEAH
jgi:NADH-quinone oxidoreductase subunit M